MPVTMKHVPKPLIRRWRRFEEMQGQAREFTNNANRAKTEFRNEFVAWLRMVSGEDATEFPRLRIDGDIISYARAEAFRIPPEKWLEWYEKKKITKQQFLDAISISKSDAEKIIGLDRVKLIEKKVSGERPDIRVEVLEKSRPGVEILWPEKPMVEQPGLRMKRKLKLKRR